MANKMLIDASHPEETRVAVVKGNRIEEFDFESEHRKQLKGNIYLARVTRVEPSLQAAFVEYGGNRHGFLAFSEIHPDYYQIPVADRLALLEAEAAAVREELDSDEEEADQRARGKSRKRRGRQRKENVESVDPLETVPAPEPVNMEQYLSEEDVAALAAMVSTIDDDVDTEPGDADEDVESVGAEDALEEVPNRRRTSRRNYKIQEVIKRRQILLVQVVKEERGNKGAALTTYLSLAGRYSVLMPNTARGGGISRKITNVQDRRRLKDIVKDLDVPQGMGVILRTAGANRTKPEIKRDYEYLMRLWDNVRNLTLESIAPTLVYEEGSLIKRSVRDLYNKEIGEVLVAGEDGYREAKDFMRMLMPSHAKSVQPYRDSTPLFAKYGIEGQLDKMLQPQVTLKSGGYIIINQTEALVAIDVNSGRSTREHSIEDTAFQTNLEAADEVARQLRLRDLAGLIVIDFIDMEEKRNNRNVEKRLKDALKNDRARIQVGRISHFGLLEMSRQRIRASVLESTMSNCPHCHGTGYIRSESSIALHVMRAIEEFLLNDSRNHITVNTPTTIALYILNNKREMLGEFEQRFGLTITIEADEEVGAQHFTISKGSAAPEPGTGISPLEYPDEPEDDEIASETGDDGSDENDEDGRNRKRRRRRRRRGNREKDGESNSANQSGDTKSGDEEEPENAQLDEDDESTQSSKRKRRRGRRGGRRSRKDETGSNIEDVESADSTNTKEPDVVGVGSDKEPGRDHVSELEKSKSAKPKDRTKKTKVEMADDSQAADVEIPDTQTESSIRSDAKPDSEKKSTNRRKGATSEAPSEPVVTSSIPNGKEEDSSAPRKGGWWQKKGFF